eukprot:SAG11_NODE_6694_length_1265_cov_1.141509_1_plen_197_part_00
MDELIDDICADGAPADGNAGRGMMLDAPDSIAEYEKLYERISKAGVGAEGGGGGGGGGGGAVAEDLGSGEPLSIEAQVIARKLDLKIEECRDLERECAELRGQVHFRSPSFASVGSWRMLCSWCYRAEARRRAGAGGPAGWGACQGSFRCKVHMLAQVKKLTKMKEVLGSNISSLYRTAVAEIGRKDAEIEELNTR